MIVFSSSGTFHWEEYEKLKVYSDWLKEKLPEEMPGKVEIINSGISGDTT